MAVNSLNDCFDYLLRFDSKSIDSKRNPLVFREDMDCLNVCSKLNYNKLQTNCNQIEKNHSFESYVYHKIDDSLDTESKPSLYEDKQTDRFDFECSRNSFESPGMRDVPKWLKVLRLHKYSYLFSGLTYEQLLSTTEDQLAQKNVTKGARNKLINCISKLKLRPKVLTALDRALTEEGIGSVRSTLAELDDILNTPLKPYECNESEANVDFINHFDSNHIYYLTNHSHRDADQTSGSHMKTGFHLSDPHLTEIITRLLDRVSHILSDVLTVNIDDQSFNLFSKCVDKCLSNSSFSLSQKTRLNEWKKNLQNIYTIQWFRRTSGEQLMRNHWNQTNAISKQLETNTYGSSESTVLFGRHLSTMSSSFSLSSDISVPQLIEPKHTNSFESHPTHIVNRFSQNEKNDYRTKSQLYPNLYPILRTNSAPMTRAHSAEDTNHFHAFDHDLDRMNDTEKLCIRMTEQALGLSDGGLLRLNIRHDF